MSGVCVLIEGRRRQMVAVPLGVPATEVVSRHEKASSPAYLRIKLKQVLVGGVARSTASPVVLAIRQFALLAPSKEVAKP
jgi:hypothetical protein